MSDNPLVVQDHTEVQAIEPIRNNAPTIDIVTQTRVSYVIEDVLASSLMRGLGRDGKLSPSQKAAASIAVAMTFEHVEGQNRQYRAAETSFLVSWLGRVFQGLRPVHINVGSADSQTSAPPLPSSLWERFGWGGITGLLAIGLVVASFYAQKGAQGAEAWKTTAEAYSSQVKTLKDELNDANDKRDEYADKLQTMNHYVGTLEGQSTAATDQQKATAAALRTILGKVDDIQKSHRSKDTSKKSSE